MNKRRGFTLVELLIVIGIILTLLSILLPAMSSARHQAKSVTCLANLRQLQLAFVNYVGNENDQRSFDYTEPVPGVLRPYFTTSWIPDLRRAGAIDSARICPEAIDIASLSGGGSQYGGALQSWSFNVPNPLVNTLGYYAGSYAINGWLYNSAPGAALSGGSTMPLATASSGYYRLPKDWKGGIPLFCDSVWLETFPASSDMPYAKLQPTTTWAPLFSNICINRHHRAINVIFLDGSAATTQLLDLWNLPWSNNYAPPSPAQLTAVQTIISNVQ
jgi:prepilin-type N-terminal cleavage/methylation domain-containing protein